MISEHHCAFEARLLASPPEVVYGELKARALIKMQKPYRAFHDLEIEASLLRRNDPLINLGLASFGFTDEILSAVYQRSLDTPRDENDARYRKGLRIACLSNRFAGERYFPSLPWQILGKTETQRLLAEAAIDEVEALLSNPNIDDNLLIGIYNNEQPYNVLDDERRRELARATVTNPRLVLRKDSEDSPDLGHGNIQKAIFHLLETAPVTIKWFTTLQALIGSLNPMSVIKVEPNCHVLDRWGDVERTNHRGEPMRGLWTSLSDVDEFRCLIAALYGQKSSEAERRLGLGLTGLLSNKSTMASRAAAKRETVILGDPGASDIALRCAYYGNAKLTAHEAQAGYSRDGDAFSFAMLLNQNVYYSSQVRMTFEEKYLTGTLKSRYLQICHQYHEQWPAFDPAPSAEWMLDVK